VALASLIAAGMPLLTALTGVGLSVLTLHGLAAALSVSNTAVTLAVMIGLAVGVDYALFIVSRHRAQLAAGLAPTESAAIAVGTAGTAVVFAGCTVIIACRLVGGRHPVPDRDGTQRRGYRPDGRPDRHDAAAGHLRHRRLPARAQARVAGSPPDQPDSACRRYSRRRPVDPW